jgi:putative endonuclease
MMNQPGHFWVYILQVKGGNYYTGYTTDLSRRYSEHVRGTARCRFTRSFPPVRIEQCWEVYGTAGDAKRVEHFVKQRPRIVKTDLIRNPFKLCNFLHCSENVSFIIKPCTKEYLDEISESCTKGATGYAKAGEGETPGKRR